MTRDHFPPEMSPELKLRLGMDLDMFGTAFYEETPDGYERVDPRTVIVGADGLPDEIEMVAPTASEDYYGVPPFRPPD